MPLRAPEPPEESVAVLREALGALAQRGQFSARGLRKARPEQLTATASHPVFVLGLDDGAREGRLDAARAGGCGGVVCSVRELPAVKSRSHLLAVVPGIRLPGGATHDQARVGTPADAIAAGADLLVVGRAVTAAPDPEAAAAELLAMVAA